MKIENHDILLDSNRLLVKQHEESEQLTVWKGNQRLEISRQNTQTAIQMETFASLDISPEGWDKFLKSADKNFSVKTPFDQSTEDESLQTPSKYQIMQMILEKFFGIKIKIITPEQENSGEGDSGEAGAQSERLQQSDSASPQPQGWGMQYSYHEVNYEKELVNFSAAGHVTTEDGREINFEVKLEMAKEKLEQLDVQLRAGDALLDPLALNFDGKGVRLTDEKFQFDLDMDGNEDNISFLEKGSGFLVLDKNQNGKVDDGSELFGPASNNGFLELKAYDEDQNDWIDENDSIYYQLGLWTKNADGSDNLSTLQENNVGALYLNSARTSFDLEEGQLRESGIYLDENGNANLLQELDLKVTA
jgi:hypothetical protein